MSDTPGEMRTVAERLQRLIDSVPGMNPTRLSRETGVPQPTIFRILRGQSLDPDTATLRPLAERFGKTVAQLRGELPMDLAQEPPGRYYFIPRYEAVAALGRGRFNDDDHIEIEGTYPIPRDLVDSNQWRVEALVVANTEGESMKPTINDGDPVVINLDMTAIVSGKVYAIETASEGLRLKRLFRQLDGRILVRCDNHDKITYPDEYLTPESGARVVGRVVDRRGEP